MSKSRCCLVIPCYNEERRLNKQAFKDFLESQDQVDFLFVNDGSHDQTLSVLKQLEKELGQRFMVIDGEKNRGKAEAVRFGFNHLSESQLYEYIGFWDADLATPLQESLDFLEHMNKGNLNAVTGARILRLGTEVKRKWYRHYLGRVFATCASLALDLSVYDTQCGSKIFRRSLIPQLFGSPFISKWLFDIELFFQTQKL